MNSRERVLCTLEKPEHLEGMSLKPILKDALKTVKEAIYSRMQNFSSVRTKDYRFTYYGETPNKLKYELFDLKIDAKENINVALNPEYEKALKYLKELICYRSNN